MSALAQAPEERFEPVLPKHLPDVVAIEQVAYAFPWTLGNFQDALNAGYSAWMLRNTAPELIAYAIVMVALDEAHLLNLTVAPTSQRQGYGWRMLDWMAQVSRGHGAQSLLLEVRPSNAPALRLYERYGFKRIGTRRGYYPAFDGREDAIVMRISL